MIDDEIYALADELRKSASIPDPAATYDASETIQLDGQSVHSQEAIPLKRRAVIRPVDLARLDENSDGSEMRDSIDNAFSELDQTQPAPPRPRSVTETEIENIFREES